MFLRDRSYIQFTLRLHYIHVGTIRPCLTYPVPVLLIHAAPAFTYHARIRIDINMQLRRWCIPIPILTLQFPVDVLQWSHDNLGVGGDETKAPKSQVPLKPPPMFPTSAETETRDEDS